MPLKICMFVFNNCQHDSRVLKEAGTLARAGHDVRIIALLDKDSLPLEERDGFKIIRIERDPIHYRILRAIRIGTWKHTLTRPLSCIRRLLVRIPKAAVRTSRSFLSKFKRRRLKSSAKLKASFLRRSFNKTVDAALDYHNHVKTIGARTHIRQNFKKHPIYFLIIGWLIISAYLFTRYGYVIAKISICRPLIILWARHLRSILKLHIIRFLKILWARHLRRIYNLGICRPFIVLETRLSRSLNNFFYGCCKKLLMRFHRPLCFLDYYNRSYPRVLTDPADVYHAHDLNTLPLAYKLHKKTGGSIVYDSHEFYVERNRANKTTPFHKFLLKRFEAFYVKNCEHVITVSSSIGKELKKRYSVKQLSIILNAPQRTDSACLTTNENITLRSQIGIDANKKIILYVGNISLNRGLENLIQSLSYLDNCVLVMMGKATQTYADKLCEVAVDSGVSDQVHFFGPVPQKQVIKYASSADIGAAPILNACLSYYYCLPNKLFECMSAGLPTIGSNFPELKKVIEGYGIGKTFDPESPQDIADAVKYILADENALNEMRKRSLEASEVFNWQNEAEKLLAIYEALDFKPEVYPQIVSA
ncbi:D-inositol 3-phosphate glycosyltransferase [Anaerohalosphaera lusitana]|uniref:D-inositol 3-phosphate glycosyltransferase n=1 Tax=Anaerohalosphaera lusitana TaxID=1936003 RepID=A0A1U9NNY2_9BACT|nr:glycosyltransferase family 4 protein [Anaerohalosphaera lusitana]AQT69609.1 D-inositol 3-phosphate glycosyltransferase [Anaerohalosphaera lusitana]